MFDDLERLREAEALFRLLAHYAGNVGEDREAWQDRLMALEGVEARALIRLHGELLAYGWIEQNSGLTPMHKPGTVACCYRPTAAGLRAFKLARAGRDTDRDLAEAA
jgi:hypothetical protein